MGAERTVFNDYMTGSEQLIRLFDERIVRSDALIHPRLMQTDPRRILSQCKTSAQRWVSGPWVHPGWPGHQPGQAQASESSSTSRTRSNQVFNQAFDLETQLGERLIRPKSHS